MNKKNGNSFLLVIFYPRFGQSTLKKIFMKNVFIVAGILASLFFSSCKKDYTCKCTTEGVTVTTTINATKSQAKTLCNGAGCELK
jgi:hypothetical protein